jgi:hypothetical protein
MKQAKTFVELLQSHKDLNLEIDTQLARLILSKRAGSFGIQVNCSRDAGEVSVQVISPTTSYQVDAIRVDSRLTLRS